MIWGIDYLGWNASWVNGYRGTSETMLALDRGEIDMTSTGNMFQIKDRLDRGELKASPRPARWRTGHRGPRRSSAMFRCSRTRCGARSRIRLPRRHSSLDSAQSGRQVAGAAGGTPDDILDRLSQRRSRSSRPSGSSWRRGEDQRRLRADVVARRRERSRHTGGRGPEVVDYTKVLMRKQGIHVQ